MCGIVALFSLSSRAEPLAGQIREMAQTLRHRGPDDEGYALIHGDKIDFLGGDDTPAESFGASFNYSPTQNIREADSTVCTAALGHRRLSIVDLAPTGHQPMSAYQGRYILTYNGEIYNYVELRDELEAEGCSFQSQSDTEVLLHAYHLWGAECLSRLNGMFAFVLVDTRENTIFAARDRFGIKPLYYWISPQGLFAFASEIKAFTVLPAWEARLNSARAFDYLNWSQNDHTHETLFQDVYQLRGGEFVLSSQTDLERMSPGSASRWYQISPKPSDPDTAIRDFRELFFDAVRLRLRADVPVGSCLSGGLDSSSIVCTAHALLNGQSNGSGQKTFSACSEFPEFDEREFIEEIANRDRIELHYVFPDLSDLFTELPDILWHHDEPFLSTSVFAEWNVFRSVHHNQVKVTLDGHGADEQLAGYHTFFGPHLVHLFRTLRWAKLWSEASAMQAHHNYDLRFVGRKIAAGVLPYSLVDTLRRLTNRKHALPDWIDCVKLGVHRDSHRELREPSTSISALSHRQLTATSVPKQLHWADRDSMAHSVESRVPFLDHRVVELLAGMPDHLKLERAVTKIVLREAMKDTLPERIRTRMDKMGFVTPEQLWVRQHGPDTFRKEVKNAVKQSRGVLTPAAVKRAEKIISGSSQFHSLVWRMICFGQWMERFSVRV